MIDKKQKGLFVGIVFAALVAAIVIWQILNIPAAIKQAKQLNDNANRLGITNGAIIGNVNIPPTGDHGKFIGKLEQLNIVAADLPTADGPYIVDTRTSSGYMKKFALAPEDQDSTQFYSAGITNYDFQAIASGANILTEASAGVTVRTFDNTSAAAHNYATNQVIDDAFREPANQNFAGYNRHTAYSSLPNVGANNTVTKTWDDLQNTHSDRFATKQWSVDILLSNANITLRMTLPFATTDDQFKQIVTNWLKRIDEYKPGTAADVQAENAGGI